MHYKWRRQWHPTPVLLPGKSHGQRSQSMGSLRVGCNWMTSLSLFAFMHWRRKWQPTPVFFPGESRGRGSLVGCHFLLQCMKVKSESEVTQLHPTLSDPMDCSLPGSSVHWIFQASVLEWGTISFSERKNWGTSNTQSTPSNHSKGRWLTYLIRLVQH